MCTKLFFYLLLACHMCGVVYCGGGGGNSTQSKTVDLFVPGKTKVTYHLDDEKVELGVNYLYSPFFVDIDGVIVVLAEAQCGVRHKKNTCVVAKYVTANGTNWANNDVIENNGGDWETQLFTKEKNENLYYFQHSRPIGVLKGDDIYLLVLNYNLSTNESHINEAANKSWSLELVVGEVTHDKSQATGISIEWETLEDFSATLNEQFSNESLSLAPPHNYSFALVSENGTLVFVVGANKENKNVSAFIYLKGKGDKRELNMSYAEITDDYNSPFSLFFWSEKLIMIPTHTGKDGESKVRKSLDMGKTWTYEFEPKVHLWNNLQDKNDFIIATVKNKNLLLFTQQKSVKTSADKKQEVSLWFMDGSRVYEVGHIFSYDNRLIFSGLLYGNDKLFFFLQQEEFNGENYNGSTRLFLITLEDKLEKIKNLLNEWDKTQKKLTQPCTEILCVTPMPINGLVSYLSNNTGGDVWRDEYLSVDAVVQNGKKVHNGFRFRGPGAGAEWPVSLRGYDKKYDFARFGLTVVARVAVHKIPSDDRPLLTVADLDESHQRLGLWYSKGKKWKLKLKKGGEAHTDSWSSYHTWEKNKAYRVALVIHKGIIAGYIEGNDMGAVLRVSSSEKRLFDPEKIFIGEYGYSAPDTTDAHVTVTDVILYNRPLSAKELEALNKRF